MIFKLISIFLYVAIFLGCSDDDESNIIVPPIFSETNSSEPLYFQQWYLDKNTTFYTQNNIDAQASINAGEVLKTYSANGVKIAIIDDGVDITHEDLVNSFIATYDITTSSTDVTHSNSNDFHGTSVSGIIGARINSKGIAGIANKAQLIFLKDSETMTDSETIELFNKAQEFGADIINCSWGTYDVSDAVKSKIVDLATNGRDGKGIIIVFASGNDDTDMGNDESAIPEVIGVSATNKYNERAYYSNYGSELDIVAPGGEYIGITTLDASGDKGMAYSDEDYFLYNDSNFFAGTSASAPIVSGVIGLMLEKKPDLTRLEIMQILKDSSDKIGSIGYVNGRNDYYGYGKINVAKIMDMIK
jgi:subtilisin family serine protease